MYEGKPTAAERVETVTMTAFLEGTPPDTQEVVDDLAHVGDHGHSVINTPDITLHCSSEHCGGKQRFRSRNTSEYLKDSIWKFVFIIYECRNCGKTQKVFALAVMKKAPRAGLAQKFGEIPTFGPVVPARVIALIGPDKEMFLKGRRSENHGLGVGAFSYYRRVVENQKNRIIAQLRKVAERLGTLEENLKAFDEALKETQFTKAVEKIKDALPPTLLIEGGHNPLTLLHDSLSDGLHAMSDEQCLEYATEIRLVLTHLAERMAEAMKSDATLMDAVGKLLARKSAKK